MSGSWNVPISGGDHGQLAQNGRPFGSADANHAGLSYSVTWLTYILTLDIS